MLIYVVRHGETDSNEQGALQGWTNDPLNDFGIELAKITGKCMQGIKFDLSISSPLIRAYDTARIILDNSGNSRTEILVDERLKEINMGKWECKKFRSWECEVPENDLRSFFDNPNAFEGFPDGETLKDVCKRTQDFLMDLSFNQEYKNCNILVSTHGCALRCMMNFLYDDCKDFWRGHVPYNCSVSIIEVKDKKLRILSQDKIYYDSSKCIDRYTK